MGVFIGIKRARKISIKKVKDTWRRIELVLGGRGIRVNIYPLLSFGRYQFKIDPFSITMEQDRVAYLLRIFELGYKKTASKFTVIKVDHTNINHYLPVLLDLEHRTYEPDHRLGADSFLLRFKGRFFNRTICFLYFKYGEPVGYTLGSSLEFYDPFEYGFEIGCHPDYLRFSAFYAENISIVPEFQKTMLMVRMILDVFHAIKRKEFSTVLIHALKGNNTHELLSKYGFVSLLEVDGYLGASLPVCFMQTPYLNEIGGEALIDEVN